MKTMPTTKPRPKRPPLSKAVYFRMSPDTFAVIERIADQEQRSVASVIRLAVEAYVREKGKR